MHGISSSFPIFGSGMYNSLFVRHKWEIET